MCVGVPGWLAGRFGSGADRVVGSAGVAAVAVVAIVSVLVGAGNAFLHPRLANVGAWLGSEAAGIVVHVNGLSGRPDGRVTVRGAAGHSIRVVQHGLSAYLVDDTGQVSRIDPSQLAVAETRDYHIGAGAQLVAGANVAYVVDAAKGVIQRIDPTTLATIGAPLSLPAPLGQSGIDGADILWVPVPATGTLVPVRAGRSGAPVGVGAPGDPLALTIVGGTPVAVDTARPTATVVGPAGPRLQVNLPSAVATPTTAGLLAPPTTDGPVLPLLSPAAGEVVTLDTSSGSLTTVQLGAGRDQLGAPQALGERVFVPDESTGSVIVYDRQSRQLEPRVPVTGRAGPLEVFVQGSLLWVNDEQGNAALVVQADGTAKHVGKYDTQVPGAGATAAPRPAATGPRLLPTGTRSSPTPTPSAPPPQAPGTVTASAGPGWILVTFTPSSGGSPTGYDLVGAPPGSTVAPSRVAPQGMPFTFQVTGGSCAAQYSFQVEALYPGGQVASAPSLPVRPCVAPDPPQSLNVTPTSGGATVTWTPPVNAAGSQPTYDLTWKGPSSGSKLGIGGLSWSVTGLHLDGTYSFTVTATNPAGTGAGNTTAVALSGPAIGYAIYGNPVAPVEVRNGSSTGATALTSIPPGLYPTVTVLCQVQGGWATDGGDPSLTGDIWDRVTYRGVTGYVSDLYVRTPMSVARSYTSFSNPPLWQC
jgi:hypothetical protein